MRNQVRASLASPGSCPRPRLDALILLMLAGLILVLNVYRWPTNYEAPLQPMPYREIQNFSELTTTRPPSQPKFLVSWTSVSKSESSSVFEVPSSGETKNLPEITTTQPPPSLPKIPVRTSLDQSEISVIEHRFSERLRLLQKGCRERRQWSNNKIELPYVHIAERCEVLEEYKVLYCEVFKAGSTFWNSLIAHLYDQQKIIDTDQYYKMLDILQAKPRQFRKIMSESEFLKFVVVREPLSRLLSAYRDRIEDTSKISWQRNHWAPLILKYTRKMTDDEMRHPNKTLKIIPTFEEFTRYVTSTPPVVFDPHWKPVTLQCGVCTYNYTVIVHTETFLDDIRYILKTSGIEKKIDLSMMTLRANKGRGNTNDLLVKYYSTLRPETLQKVIDIYKEDFKLFGYDPTETLKEEVPSFAHIRF